MSAKLEIAFFGSSLVSAYWNGAATYYRGIIRALAELAPDKRFLLGGEGWADRPRPANVTYVLLAHGAGRGS